MANIDAETREAWRKNPDAMVSLIIRVTGDIEKRTEALEARGVEIKRRFRLTQSLGVRCTAKTALGLLRLSWITKVEPDRPVRALRR
ncbi:MAG TPA: hypothetical protein GX702_15580 [Chloroflexi bacterium]|jgi:energy-coupling factor transporter transmembrane protein EcfT|nr:hypothetical protein [Chloroflexota bacterium]